MSERGKAAFWWLLAGLAAVYVALKTIGWLGGDATVFYYGTRLLLSGGNPYNTQELIDAWRRSGAPVDYRPGPPSFFFVYPASIAVLYVPCAGFSWRVGLFLEHLFNYTAGLAALWLLLRMSSTRWKAHHRALFVLYALTMPAYTRLLWYGQSGILICACLAASLYALSRRRDVLSGVFMALALGKFTLALPFVLLAAYRGKGKMATVSLGVFAILNLVLMLPIGIGRAVQDYRLLAESTLAPGGINDLFAPLGDNFSAMQIQVPALMTLLLGPHPSAVNLATKLLTPLLIISIVWVYRRPKREAPVFDNPLEVAVAAMAALVLFYHRYYDIVLLMFVAWGLWEYALRYPNRVGRAWRWTGITLLFFSFCTSARGISTILNKILAHLGGLQVELLNPALNLLLLLQVLYLLHLDRRLEEAEASAPAYRG